MVEVSIVYTLHLHCIYIAFTLHLHCIYIAFTLHLHILHILHCMFFFQWPTTNGPNQPGDTERAQPVWDRSPKSGLYRGVAWHWPLVELGWTWGWTCRTCGVKNAETLFVSEASGGLHEIWNLFFGTRNLGGPCFLFLILVSKRAFVGEVLALLRVVRRRCWELPQCHSLTSWAKTMEFGAKVISETAGVWKKGTPNLMGKNLAPTLNHPNFGLPVVPHKAVAEVSKIGNL